MSNAAGVCGPTGRREGEGGAGSNPNDISLSTFCPRPCDCEADMTSVRCDDVGDASAERGVGGVTIGSAAARGGERAAPGALCDRGGDPKPPPSFSFPPSPTLGKSTRPAANTPRVMSLSRWTDGRAGLGLFASRSMRSAASVSTARVGAFVGCA